MRAARIQLLAVAALALCKNASPKSSPVYAACGAVFITGADAGAAEVRDTVFNRSLEATAGIAVFNRISGLHCNGWARVRCKILSASGCSA